MLPKKPITLGACLVAPPIPVGTLFLILYDPLALRMSPNAASPQTDTQSLHYIIRSGLAGGIAGCVVSRFLISFVSLTQDIGKDRRRSS